MSILSQKAGYAQPPQESADILDKIREIERTMYTLSREEQLVIERRDTHLIRVREFRELTRWLNKPYHFTDERSGKPILTHQTASRFFGKKPGKVNTGKLLRGFQRYVAPEFAWTEYRRPTKERPGMARVIDNTGMEELSDRILGCHDEQRIYVETGKSHSKRAQMDSCRKIKKLAKGLIYKYPTQEKVARVMHALSVELVVMYIERNIHDAFEAAKARGDKEGLAILHNLWDYPYTIYSVAKRGKSHCPRLYGKWWQQVPAYLRRILLPDCIEFDFKNIQIAVLAKMLGITCVQEFLATGKSFWDELLDYLQITGEQRAQAKSIVKDTTYAIIYGMEEKTADWSSRKNFREAGICPKERLLGHPLIKAILEAIRQAEPEIRAAGGMQGADRFYAIEEGQKFSSFLSIVAESYEIDLVSTCFDPWIAERGAHRTSTHDIMVYLFDGFIVHVREGADRNDVIARICSAGNTRAAAHGICTKLEVSEPLESPPGGAGAEREDSLAYRLSSHLLVKPLQEPIQTQKWLCKISANPGAGEGPYFMITWDNTSSGYQMLREAHAPDSWYDPP